MRNLLLIGVLLLTSCNHNPLASPQCKLSADQFLKEWKDCECNIGHYSEDRAIVTWAAVASGGRASNGYFYKMLAANGELGLDVFLPGAPDKCVPELEDGAVYLVHGHIGWLNGYAYSVAVDDAQITLLHEKRE